MTFTQRNQHELNERLFTYAGQQTNIEVMGWYTLLLRHFAKPFLPFAFPGRKVLGFDYEGFPPRFSKGWTRFFNRSGAVYASELSRLAHDLIDLSEGALLFRLQSLYDEILVDEVQDLSGWDWDILKRLFDSPIDIRMVGDVRQSVLSTSPRTRKTSSTPTARRLTGSWRCKSKEALRSSFEPQLGAAAPASLRSPTRFSTLSGGFRLRSRSILPRQAMMECT